MATIAVPITARSLAAWVGDDDRPHLIRAMRSGIAPQAAERLAEDLELNQAELAELLGRSRRTLSRRSGAAAKPLVGPEAERLVRYLRLFKQTMDVFGTPDEARRWLKAPRSVFGGETPLAMASTELGAQEVEHLLGRIQHGIFS